jgi:AAA ATPase containing von Willebrand factor type A (vWA) domain
MSTRRIRYAITDNNITVNYDGQTHIVPRTDVLADKLIEAVRSDDLDQIPELVSASKRVERYGKGDFQVVDGLVHINGVAVADFLSRKILKFQAEGLPHMPLVRFAKNLQDNPSYRAVNELFTFLEKNDHPLTEDGNFIAYKRVRGDFKDIHSGTMDNSPGQVVKVPRNQVDEDSTRTCSYGLHVANWWYANSQYSSCAEDVMLEVEVNPAHVVAIPVDYNNSKMRVCEYKVLGVVDKENSSGSLRTTSTPSDEDDHEGHACEEEDEESEDQLRECEDCGTELYSHEDTVCDDCASCRDDDDDEEEDEEEEEEDTYPFDDELDEEE